MQRAHLISSLLEEGPDICRLQVGMCSRALQVRSLRGRLSRGRGTGNAATGRCRRTRGTCSANAVQGCKRASVTRRRGSKALDNGAQTQSASDQRHLIQGRAAAALSESWAHRRRRDSERQETWRLELQQPAQRMRARLRRWDLQRRVLSVPLQCSRRDRSGSATDAERLLTCQWLRDAVARQPSRQELHARPVEQASCFEPCPAKQAPEAA